ncbi:hypothetical protein FIBSPDRAFT_958862 [Athelia psychrophila]|uniref:Uncharacterized protein n=1 Tax=Athelia psychrophila TaxID=1759441 RepID=A0A166E3V6_9AGAM|nr:hypothetical protein FIBSPDRAFT_958862 [Fibularhizoctonia sp. CBS 109695]
MGLLARITLGDVLKRQGQDSKGEIPLICLSTAGKRDQSGRNKQQKYSACFLEKLRTPASFASESETSTLLDLNDMKDEVHDMSDGYPCKYSSPERRHYQIFKSIYSGYSSDTLSAPPTPTGDVFKFPTIPDHKPKSQRRRVRGYSMGPAKEGELSEVSIEDGDYDADDAGEEDQAQITV